MEAHLEAALATAVAAASCVGAPVAAGARREGGLAVDALRPVLVRSTVTAPACRTHTESPFTFRNTHLTHSLASPSFPFLLPLVFLMSQTTQHAMTV